MNFERPALLPAHEVRGSGEPLLLIAGTAFAGATWPPVLLEALAARRTVVSFDNRGTGSTPATAEPYSTRLFAADAAELLDLLALGAADVLGHSMGGRVAQWLALDRPELVRSLVLAATGPGHYAEDVPAVTGVPLQHALGIASQGYRGFLESHTRSTFFTPEARSSAEADWLLDAFWAGAPDLEGYLRHVIARQQHNTVGFLDRIRQPALVLVGDRDTHRGGTGSHLEQSRFLAEHLPNSEYAELPGVSHGYFWEATERSAETVLAWLPPRSSGSR